MLLAIFCLLFILIGGVSASDVVDMSNNPENNNLVSDSVDSTSGESVDNSYTNQLSNEAVSTIDQSMSDSNSVGIDNEESKIKASSTAGESSSLKADSSSTSSTVNSNSTSTSSDSSSTSSAVKADSSSTSSKTDVTSYTSSKNTAKKSTSLKLTKAKIHSGTPIVITLRDSSGKVLSGKTIKIRVPSKKRVFYKKTNSKGQVKLNYHKIGSFKTIVTFKGDKSFKSSKFTRYIKVKKSGTRLIVSSTKVPRSTPLIVTLKNKKSGLGISDKKIKFRIPKWNNRTYIRTTNSKGQAKLVISAKKRFSVIISFAGTKNLYKSKAKKSIKPIKCQTKFTYSGTELEYGEDFVVTLRKVNGEPVKNKKVKIKITNKNLSYTRKTNSKGQFTVPIGSIGTYNTKISFAGTKVFVKSSVCPNLTVVKGATKLEGSETELSQDSKYYITLKNSAGKVLSNRKVEITFRGNTFTKKTNSNGKIALGMNYTKGSYKIQASYSGDDNYNSSEMSTTIKIGDPSVSISKIVSAAKDLKSRVDYISILNKEYTVTIDKRRYTMDEFAYLMAGALVNLKSGSKANVKIKDLSNNYKSNGAKINGRLSKKEYLKLASDVVKFVDSKKRIPNYKSTRLGKVEANLYVYTFASILTSYGKNKKLPKSVKVKTKYVRGGFSTSISQGGRILNYRQIFDSGTFAQYLKTGGKSALNNAIKNKAKAITAGLKNPRAKAIAIFRYVRDDITYSFYTNSLKGASGTLSSRSGNCCDKANLIVAMCRSVGVYARYSHAQGCRFQSGLYTGHVWAQVYDTQTQTWYTADATSYRNELGNIKNWNTKSYYRDKNYALIPF